METSLNPLGEFTRNLADRIEGLKGDSRHAYDDLEFYADWVMGHDNDLYKPNSRFLKQVYKVLQDPNETEVLILGPRDSAKSSAASVTFTTWAIGRNPLTRILMGFSSVETQGLAFGRQIEHILTRNERYINIFGELVPPPGRRDRWSDYEKIVLRPEPPGGLKDPTLALVGVGSNVPSKRADILILDDVVTAQNAYTPLQRAKVETFVFQVCFPVVAPGGRYIIIGSRWDPRDLYHVVAGRWGLRFPESVPIEMPNFAEVLS